MRSWLVTRIRPANPKGDDPVAVPYLLPLTPKYDRRQHGVYFGALQNALKQPSLIKNIALTGAYGVGKSSILQEVTRTHRRRSISLSLSTLGLGQDTPASTGAKHPPTDAPARSDSESKTNQIQKEIVKQLLYSEDPIRMSGSRFGRMTRFRPWRAILLSSAVSLVILAIFALTGWSERLAAIANIPSDWRWTAHLVVFAATALVTLLVVWLTNNRIQISQVGAGTATIALSPKSSTYFDEYLDEIVYFFEIVKKDIVIFEDIDRFDDPHIFETLRALNTLLNSAKQLRRRRVRFIYAIKDSIFEEIGARAANEEMSEDKLASDDGAGERAAEKIDLVVEQLGRANRTKFFDLVIPVVPFITHRSARNLLATRMDGIQPPIAVDLIDLAARHIADMRLILDVRNEYVVFKSRVIDSSTLNLDPDVLFAMILYKITHLSDFERIRLGTSRLDLLDQDRIDLIDQNIEGLNDRVRYIRSQMSRLRTVRGRGKILGANLLTTLKQSASDFGINLVGFAFQSQDRTEADLQTDEFWQEFVAVDAPFVITFRRNAMGQLTQTLTRAQIAERVRDSLNADEMIEVERSRLNEELTEATQDIAFLASADMGQLMSRPDFSLTRGEVSKTFEECARERLQSELAVQLVTAGKIDRNFTLYTSTFYADRVSANATNFIIKNVDPNVVAINYVLTDDDVESVLREKGTGILRQRVAFNLSLVNYLLEKSPADLGAVLRQLAVNGEPQRAFLTAFLARGEQKARFVSLLVPIWDRAVIYLAVEAELDDDLRVEMVDTALKSLEKNTRYLVDDSLKRFFDEHFDQLPVFTSSDTTVSTSILLAELVHRAGVSFPDISLLGPEVLRQVVNRRGYVVTRSNLEVALGGPGVDLALDSIRAKNERVYAHVKENLSAYRETLKENEVTIRSNDAFVDIVEDLLGSEIVNLPWVVEHAEPACVVQDLSVVSGDAWGILAEHSRFAPSVANVDEYLRARGVDKELADFLTRAGVIEVAATDPENRKQSIATAILAASELIPSQEDRVKLVASLQLDQPMPISAVPVERGTLVGLLLDGGIVEDDVLTFAALESDDIEGRAFAIQKSANFLTYMTPTEVTPQNIGKLFDSRVVPLPVKDDLIRRLTEFTVGASLTTLTSMARYASDYGLTVTISEAARLAEEGVDSEYVLPLLQQHLGNLTQAELVPVLTDLGGDYARMTARNGNRPKLHDTEANRALVHRLQDFDLMASAPIVGDEIHVRMRPRPR